MRTKDRIIPRENPLKYGAVICLTLALFACGKESVNPTVEALTLDEWKTGSVESYKFEQRVICFCAAPAGRFHRITVEDGQIISAVDVETGQSLASNQFDFFKTIEGLIDFFEAIDPDSVARLDVRLDPEQKYPSFIYVDYDARIADEEIGYESRAVTIVGTE